MKRSDIYCVIMAGGSGTRFWPQSRENRSKQFLTMLGKHSLIQSTVNRFKSFISPENIYIVAKMSQEDELKKHVTDIHAKNILLEPVGKNTAPCIGLAGLLIQKRQPDSIVIVSPADHLIQKDALFRKTIYAAVKLAREKDGLVTIGISPDRPATGYGYIQISKKVGSCDSVDAYHVKTFAEKPNPATAQRFLRSGDFLWNSGLFIFKVSVILRAIADFMPDLYDGLMEIRKVIGKTDYFHVLKEVYNNIKSQSIDYGIMEKAKNVFIIKGDFKWSDLGSWEQVYKLSPKDKNGNVVSGEAVLMDTKNSYIYTTEGVVSVLGMEDVVVVQGGGAILICKRERAEEVKQIVEQLKRKKYMDYV